MFARTAEILTKKLKENNTITVEQYEICRYGFQQGLTIILNAVTTIVIGAVFGELWQVVYRKTTLMITAVEIIMFFISLTFGWKEMALCIVWVLVVMAVMLLGGKWKNEYYSKRQ